MEPNSVREMVFLPLMKVVTQGGARYQLFLYLILQVHFSWMFLVGTIPAFASFFAVSLLTHYGDWDPILIGLKKLVNSKRQLIVRYVRRQVSQVLGVNILIVTQ